MGRSKYVLCVLLEKQQKEYQKELAQLGLLDADFIFESDPEKALAAMGKSEPHMVIIGMDIGPLEGIEFMTMIMNRYPKYLMPVVMLPDKQDNLPPVAHTRDPSTGHSAVEDVELDYLAKLISQPPPDVSSSTQTPAKKANNFRSLSLFIAGGLVVIIVILFLVLFLPADDTQKTNLVTDSPKSDTARSLPRDEANLEKEKLDIKSAQQAPAELKATKSDPLQIKEFLMPLSFEHGKGAPTITDPKALVGIVKTLQKHSDTRIELTGHTSILGKPELNYEIGMVRAKLAMNILIKHGISRYRFVLKSVGETEPIASNQTPAGQAKNRRVTIRLIREP